MTTATPAIQGVGLVRTYRRGAEPVHALRQVDIEVPSGEFLAVMGPSGSGKSTLLHCLAGIDRPDEGDVLLDGQSLASLSEDGLSLLRRRRVGIVLQFFNLLPTMTAVENVAFPLMLDGVRDAEQRAMAELERVGLAARAGHLPSALSGGEQQRVAVARSLVTKPVAIFADEPTGALDSASAHDVLRLLRAVADDGHTVVMVTHDPTAASFADRVATLRDGAWSDDDAAPAAAPRPVISADLSSSRPLADTSGR